MSSVKRWDATAYNNPTEVSETKYGHNITGSVTYVRDPLGHQNLISYADSFSDSINRNTFAYSTTVTEGATAPSQTGFNSYLQYNFHLGAKTRAEGPPPHQQTLGRITTFAYDAAARLELVTTVNNGAYTRYVYGPNYVESWSSVNNVADEAHSVQFFAGMGQVVASLRNHPGSAGGNSVQLTYYDIMGRAGRQSNPTEISTSWFPSGDDAAGWLYTTQTYDWNSRPLRATHPDLTYKEASYGGCGCAGGAVMTLTDEGTIDGGTAKRRQQKIYADVLGRTVKTEVLNWQGGSVYSATVNSYNARDQVTQVRQYAGPDGSATFQDTTMTYDGYGRLKTRHVPEQNAGTATTWDYKADDTIEKITDARGASQTFSYNSRHLVTGVTYAVPGGSGITVPAAVSFDYDAAGNRTSMSDGSGSTSYHFDQLSRMDWEERTFAGLSGTYRISYGYNLANQLTSLSEPSQFGSSFAYTYDTVGRLTGVTGSPFGGVTAYASNSKYRAWGGIKELTYGNAKTLNANYNSRMQAASYLIPGVLSKTYDYHADGSLRFSSDLLGHKFDRSYGYNHEARITKALSGAEARGEPTTNDRPYNQTLTYDGMGHLTDKSGMIWSDYISTSNNTYVNNRHADWSYDADGNLLTNTDLTYSYDAPGNIRTVATSDPETSTTRVVDFSGQQVKTEETFRDPDTGVWSTPIKKYYLRSSVLGGQVLSEINEDGTKLRTFVFAGGNVLAWQVGQTPPAQRVVWEHRDPSGASFRTSDANGYIWGIGPGEGPAELDPTGANAGIHAPLILPGPPAEDGSLMPYPSFSDPRHPGRTYSVDGMTVTLDYFLQTLENYHGNAFDLLTPKLRNVYVFARGDWGEFGTDLGRARDIAKEYNGVLVKHFVSWSFLVSLVPQGPNDPNNQTPLTTEQLKSLREDTENEIKARKECLDFIASLLVTAAKNSLNPLYSTAFLTDPIKIFDAVADQRGFFIVKGLKSGGQASGYLVRNTARISYGSLANPGYNGAMGLAEILHHAGSQWYSDQELAWAGYETLMAQGYSKVKVPPKTNGVPENSQYFHSDIVFRACAPTQVKK